MSYDEDRFLAPADYMIKMYANANTLTTIRPSTEQMELTIGEVIPDFEIQETFVLQEYREFLNKLKIERED